MAVNINELRTVINKKESRVYICVGSPAEVKQTREPKWYFQSDIVSIGRCEKSQLFERLK